MTLKLKLQIQNFSQRIHVKVISTTIRDLSDLPLLGYRTKYVKMSKSVTWVGVTKTKHLFKAFL